MERDQALKEVGEDDKEEDSIFCSPDDSLSEEGHCKKLRT